LPFHPRQGFLNLRWGAPFILILFAILREIVPNPNEKGPEKNQTVTKQEAIGR